MSSWERSLAAPDHILAAGLTPVVLLVFVLSQSASDRDQGCSQREFCRAALESSKVERRELFAGLKQEPVIGSIG
jgi:hypothetical protein